MLYTQVGVGLTHLFQDVKMFELNSYPHSIKLTLPEIEYLGEGRVCEANYLDHDD